MGMVSVPVVATTEVLYHDAARRPLQDVMTCIRLGCTLRAAGTRIKPNAEHDLKPHMVMAARFADDPEALANTRVVADRCHFTFDEIRYRYPGEALPEGVSESEHLRAMTWAGAVRRYPEGVPAETQKQLADLGMRDARLGAELTTVELGEGAEADIPAWGVDQLELTLAANPGEPARPLE